MARVTKHNKALRLISERRVRIVKADSSGIWALVRGDHGEYQTKLFMENGILQDSCTCAYPAKAYCSHLEALSLVWAENAPERQEHT